MEVTTDDEVFEIGTDVLEEGVVFQNDFLKEDNNIEDSIEDTVEDIEATQSLIKDSSVEIDGDDKERSCEKRLRKQTSTFEDIQSFVQEETLMHEIQDAGIVQGLNNYINDSVGTWECKNINVAITGNSGSGKSSLINALRGLTPKSPDAANVGIMETTTDAKKYKFPESDKVTLWDLPGIGTYHFTREAYLDKFELSKFDIIVVVTANRLLENDQWIAKQALGLGRSVLFVRTKIDFDLMNARRDDPDNFDEVSCMESIKRDVEENVGMVGIEQLKDAIFLISSPDRDKYDFPKLSAKLRSLMNTTGEGICSLLLEYLKKAVEEKRDAVNNQFVGKKVASAIFGALPIPKLETTFGILTVREIRDICLRTFSLDELSLEKISREIEISVCDLKSTHLKTFNTEQLNDVDKLYIECEESRYSTFRKYSKYLVPIVGSVLSACKSSRITQDCQAIISGIMADDEFHLVELRLQRLEKQLRPI